MTYRAAAPKFEEDACGLRALQKQIGTKANRNKSDSKECVALVHTAGKACGRQLSRWPAQISHRVLEDADSIERSREVVCSAYGEEPASAIWPRTTALAIRAF